MEKIFPIRYMLALLPLKTGSEFASLGCPQRQDYGCSKKLHSRKMITIIMILWNDLEKGFRSSLSGWWSTAGFTSLIPLF